MRARIRLLLLLVAALPLLAMTCVTSTRQRGEMGPWVGEVTNYSDVPVRQAQVSARLTDAAGRDFGVSTVYTCPSFLVPGERAAFELFFSTDANLDVTPPLHAEFSPVASAYPAYSFAPGLPILDGLSGEGLVARAMGTYADKHAALIEVRNESAATYSQLSVCATLRTPSGTLAEVGHTDVFPSSLRPGESVTVPVFFNSMPDGIFDAIARGSNTCCQPLSFDPAEFEVQHTRVVMFGSDRVLVVTGELRNRQGDHINWVRLGAYAEGNPVMRVTTPLACGGTVRAGDAAAGVFAIPLDRGMTSPEHLITGIEALPQGSRHPLTVSRIAVERLGEFIGGLDVMTVTATLHNPTSKSIYGTNACATMRDDAGRVVAVAPLFETPQYGYPTIATIPPGGWATVTGTTFVIGEAASTSIQAFGSP